MTSDVDLPRLLRSLLEKLALDRAAGVRRLGEIEAVVGTAAPQGPSIEGVALVALALDRYYCSLESSFEAILRVFDADVPSGPDWHRLVLARVAQPAPTRPAVLRAETAACLTELLRFRHFLRHGYAVELDWARLEPLAAAHARVHARVVADLAAFGTHVERCLADAELG